MSHSSPIAETEAPPQVQVIQMATAFWASKIVYTAAQIGLADHLSEGPRSAEEISEALGKHAPTLHRFMRTLAGMGILTQKEGQRFGLTPLGECLTTSSPCTTRASILSLASPWAAHPFDELEYCLETGRTGFEKQQGMPIFDFLAQNPEIASMFSETMVGFHGTEPAAVAAAYDFAPFETVVDVGGATGNLLSAVLSRHEGPRGILFDMPHVVGDAPALLESRGVTNRVTIASGNFFEAIPAGGDVYMMSHIIHDWNEEQCLTILGNCREAMKPDGRLLLVEMVLPPGDTPHLGKMMDMVMLVLPGGQERTAAEYEQLLEKAGFRMQSVIPTESAVSIIEAVQA